MRFTVNSIILATTIFGSVALAKSSDLSDIACLYDVDKDITCIRGADVSGYEVVTCAAHVAAGTKAGEVKLKKIEITRRIPWADVNSGMSSQQAYYAKINNEFNASDTKALVRGEVNKEMMRLIDEKGVCPSK